MGLRIKAGAINSGIKFLFEDFSSSKYGKFEKYFSSFLKELQVKHACFLLEENGFFFPAFPFGFKVSVFHKMKINVENLLSKQNGEGFYIPFSSNEYSLVKDFLSDEEYSKLKEIIFYPLEEDGSVYLLLLNIGNSACFDMDKVRQEIKSFSQEYFSDKKIIQSTKNINCLNTLLSAQSKIKGAVFANAKVTLIKFSFKGLFSDYKKNMEDLFFLRLFYSMVNRIILSAGKSNLAVLDSSLCLKVYVFSANFIDEVLYTSQIKNILASVYGDSAAKTVSVEIAGYSCSEKDFKNLLEESYKPLHE